MSARLFRILVVFLASLGTWYTALAQIPGEDWTRIALLGLNTRAIAVSPQYSQGDGTLWAGTQGAGVWYSNDYGATWTQSTGSNGFETKTVTDLAVSPDFGNDGEVYAITVDGRIFQSTNGGVTFSIQLAGITAQGTSLGISADFASDGKLWAGFNGAGLYTTSNRGGTWSHDSSSPINIYDLVPSPANDGSLYVAASTLAGVGPVFKRSGSGAWTHLSDFPAGRAPVISLAASRPGTSDQVWAGTAAYGMYISTNGGGSWVAGCDGSTQNTVPSVQSLAVSHNSIPLLLEGRSDGLYRSTGSPPGASCAPTTPRLAIQAIAFEPAWNDAEYCHIYVGTPRGLFLKGCAIPSSFDPPRVVDAKAVALANGMHGAFLGSGSQGLFKAESRDLTSPTGSKAMVQYNNFPNKLIPDIVAVCLDPLYDETATTTSCGDASTLFVAANFPDAPADNGVYKSSDWGNTWIKLTGGAWTTAALTMNDLAISPQYREGTGDITLYAASSKGLFRWDGGTVNWVNVSPETGAAVYKIGLPPTFYRLGTGNRQTLFVAALNNIFYSTNLGASWDNTNYASAACGSISTVTGFAFPGNWGTTGTLRLFVSNSSTSCNTIHTSLGGSPWTTWASLNDGLPAANIGAYGIAAEPDFTETTTQRCLICATPGGTYRGTFRASTGRAYWQLSSASPALSVSFDVGGTGSYAMAGFQQRGAALSDDGGQTYSTDFKGYNSLPDDVFQTLPNTRNPDILFASSPAMGVFISEDKGGSFRPWNKGGSGGPCALRDAVGLAMMQDRGGTGWDAVWAGNDGTGIKFRFIYWNGTSYSLDTCGSCRWQNTNLSTGRFERFATLPVSAGGTSARVYAASPLSGTGIYFSDPTLGNPYSTWTNASVPGGAAHSVKFGYVPLISVTPLASGVPTGAQSVAYDAWNYYSITVPSGMGSLQVTLTPSAGDPDLYVRRGDLPNLSLWDYRPYLGGLSVETVTVNFPTPGIYYLGVRGYVSGTSTYNLLATVDTDPLAPALERLAATPAPKPELDPFESAPGPKAPGGGSIWGTVNGAVVLGDGSGWEERNGQPPNQLTNPDTQTVLQLKDGTLVLGCLGDAFYSPQPDEGLTTWISSTAHFAGTCSYDFRDLYQVDLDPAAPSDMRADCLMAAYGTGASTSGGVWLSGDKGHHWMKISSGFDPLTQKLNSIISDAGELGSPDGTTAYYSSTDGTGVYTRTITLQAYPTVSSVSPSTGNVAGGDSVTVTGTGFSRACPTGAGEDCPDSNPVVLFGITEAATSWTSSTSLTATVPPHALGGVTVTVRNPDTRQAVTGPTYTYNACSNPTGAGTISATDLDPYLKSGVLVTWPQDCTWNDGDPTGRLYRVLRGGVDISGALPYGTTTYTDLTGSVGVSYNYSVRYTSGCALSVTSATRAAADNFLVPPEAASTPAAALQWTSGLKTQLTWGATTGATGYKLYKGADTEISKLPAPGASVCIGYQGAGVIVDTRLGTTATITNNPTSGHFFWYILAATNGAGDGPFAAGQVVSSTGACASP